jgi:PAS domain S-box-containing protein
MPMRIRSHVAAQLLEGLEAVGIERTGLMLAVGLEPAEVADRFGWIEWTTFVALLEHAWTDMGRDAERMRGVGRAIAKAPSYALLQGLARTVVSVQRIYDIGTRWGALASMPHLSLEHELLSDRRIRFRGHIPEPHAPSIPFHHVFEGIVTEVPTLLGLPRATIESSVLTARDVDLVLRLPRAASIGERLGRAVRAALKAGDEVDLLEEERQKLEEALREARRSVTENRELLERLPDYVMVHREGVLLWMNRANVVALGYESSEQLAGRPLLDLVEPASRELIVTRMRRPIGEAVPEVSEIRLMTRDGRVLVVEISPAQLVVFEGKPARLIIGRDVTDRVRMQQQLLVADRMASVGLLAAGVAHEVNNPLAYVLNNIEFATRELASLGEAAAPSLEMLEVALEGVDRIRTIVRDLLALSRDDSALVPVDVVAVVESTLKLAHNRIAETATLSLSIEPVPAVSGSVARVGQVVLNLLTNALQSMRRPESRDNRLRVAVRPSSSGGAVIEVSDNGEGIAPEHATRIFDPFFTTKAAGTGTGLGLPICQRLVSEMRGQLTFESSPGIGTTFRVTLPAWEVPPRPEVVIPTRP